VGKNGIVDAIIINVLHVLGLANNLFSITNATSLGNILNLEKTKV
jgi:hypothetical protein